MSSGPYLPAIAAVGAAAIGSVCALADTAITTLTSARLGALLEQASGPTKRALERIRDDEAKLRSRYLVGRIFGTAMAAVCFDLAFEPILPTTNLYWTLLLTVLVSATLFEITTTLGRRHADRVAPLTVRYLLPVELLVLPIAVPLSWIGEYLGRKEAEANSDPRVAEAEVEIMVEEVERSGLFGREPAEMIRNVLEFADRTARDVMVPRTQVEAIEISTPIDRAKAFIADSGHSRYAVYKEQLDNIVGLVYAKDLFKALEKVDVRGTTLKDLLRPANFVAESQPLASLLREMRSRRQHLAIVVDELGALAGIVTLEDVLEEIVGDIRDEHDDAGELEEAPAHTTPPPAEDEAPASDSKARAVGISRPA